MTTFCDVGSGSTGKHIVEDIWLQAYVNNTAALKNISSPKLLSLFTHSGNRQSTSLLSPCLSKTVVEVTARWRTTFNKHSTHALTQRHVRSRLAFLKKHKEEKKKKKALLWQNAVYLNINTRAVNTKYLQGCFEGGYGTGLPFTSWIDKRRLSWRESPSPSTSRRFIKAMIYDKSDLRLWALMSVKGENVDNLQSAFADAGLRYNNNCRRIWSYRVTSLEPCSQTWIT